MTRRYGELARSGWRELAAYPANILGMALTYCLFIFVFSQLWRSVYAGQPDLASTVGYNQVQMVWYFVITELAAFGGGGFFFRLSSEFRSGDLVYTMNRPGSPVAYHLALRLGQVTASTLVHAVLGSAIVLLAVGPLPLDTTELTLRVPMVAASLAIGIVIQYLLHFSLALLVFWTEDNSAFFWIFQKASFVLGVFMPLEFLPPLAEKLAWFTPFPAISYIPARLLVRAGSDKFLPLLGWQFLWLLIAILICLGVWSLARRRLCVNGG